jgi:glycosyltransferase involved in cell wall biosynthesis
MRITFVLPWTGLQGGIRVIATHAQRLAQRGHAVNIVSTPQTFTAKQTLKSLLRGTGWPHPEPSYFDNLTLPHRVLDTARPVTDDDVPDADVVIATYYTTARGVLSLSPAKGAKAIFIQGYEVNPGQRIPALDASWRMPMHKILISHGLRDRARDQFGDSSVSHVPNSVDVALFHAPKRTKQLLPTVGLLYSTVRTKGCRVSMAALERIAEAAPGLRIICFGAEPVSWRLPLPARAEFHLRPAQHRLRELYAQCDVWLCGSHAEGFHLPPLEAMACRCPVVSTRVGGPLDTVEEGVNGHLVAVGDAQTLADQALRVLTLSQPDWAAMSDAAHATAAHYTWDDANYHFEQALELAIERRRRGDFAPRQQAAIMTQWDERVDRRSEVRPACIRNTEEPSS